MATLPSITKNISNIPIIIILGSTATGKSKLGIELAKKFNGEIISADSMQVYKGLDIITNKVSKEEQNEVAHHLINIVSPPSEFSVVEFKRRALDIIESLSVKKKLPIVVGGTNYYIESLLWNVLVDDGAQNIENSEVLGNRKKIKLSSKSDGSFSLFDELNSVDPERAAELHPNDERKISRSLQIFRTSGKKHSEFLKEQKNEYGSSHLGGPMRFSKSIVFWLTCKQDVLDARISERLNGMLSKGLEKEISDFYKIYEEKKYDTKTEEPDLCQNVEIDSHIHSYKEGLFQAIGFKEFHSYLAHKGIDTTEKEQHLKDGIEALKRTTIKYSKKQKTWVTNRFLAREEDNSPDVYQLDVTDLTYWESVVSDRAFKITDAFLNGDKIPDEPMERIKVLCDSHKKYTCEICNGKIIMGDKAWKDHSSSRRHKRSQQRKRKELSQ